MLTVKPICVVLLAFITLSACGSTLSQTHVDNRQWLSGTVKVVPGDTGRCGVWQVKTEQRGLGIILVDMEAYTKEKGSSFDMTISLPSRIFTGGIAAKITAGGNACDVYFATTTLPDGKQISYPMAYNLKVENGVHTIVRLESIPNFEGIAPGL